MTLPDSKFIRRPQLEAIMAHLAKGANGQRDRLLVLLAASCGLRVTEAVNLELANLRDVGRGWLWVRSAKKRDKSGERPLERIPIAPEVAEAARAWARKCAGPYLFEGRANGHMSERQAFHIFATAARACGFGHKSFHALRHYRGFTVQEACGDATITQRMLRHNNLRSTQVYTQRTPDEERELAKEIGW